jgi:hypothetical protein
MSDSFLAYQNPTTTDKKLDSESLVVGVNTVERERIQLSGASALEIARVLNTTPGVSDYGIVTRPVLTTGDNTIGRIKLTDGTTVASVRDLASNDALNVAIVDGSGGQITSFGGGTQYTEDDASAANPVGNQILSRRRDTLVSEVSADGDVIALNSTSKGELYTKHVDNLPVIGPTAIGVAPTTNPVYICGLDPITGFLAPITSTDLPVGVKGLVVSAYPPVGTATLGDAFTANSSWVLNEGETGPARFAVGCTYFNGTTWDRMRGDTNGVFITGNVAHDAVDAGNPTKLGGKASSSVPAAVANADRVNAYFDLNGRLVTLLDTALPAGTNNIGDVDVLTLPSIPAGTNNIGDVDVLSLPSIPTGSNNIGTVDGSNIEGDVAHDGVNSGNPVQIGREAIAHGSNPTAVAAGNRTKLYANRAGIPFFIGGHPNIITLEATYTAAQTDAAIVTVGSGTKIVVTQIQFTCDADNTVVVNFRIGFGAANTPTTTGVVLTHGGLVPGSGISRGDGNGILGIGADGEDLRITCSVPTGGEVRVLVSYYTIES